VLGTATMPEVDTAVRRGSPWPVAGGRGISQPGDPLCGGVQHEITISGCMEAAAAALVTAAAFDAAAGE
jgi:hypothetical protein